MLGQPVGVVIGEIEGVDLLGADRALEGCGGVFHKNFAVVDDSDPVAELVGLLHIVRGEHDGDAFLSEAPNGFPHGDPALGIEACAGFIEEENFGAVRDRSGDLNTLSEPARELGRVGICAFGEVELLKELHGPLFGCSAG